MQTKTFSAMIADESPANLEGGEVVIKTLRMFQILMSRYVFQCSWMMMLFCFDLDQEE